MGGIEKKVLVDLIETCKPCGADRSFEIEKIADIGIRVVHWKADSAR